jgi:hypothetical protein
VTLHDSTNMWGVREHVVGDSIGSMLAPERNDLGCGRARFVLTAWLSPRSGYASHLGVYASKFTFSNWTQEQTFPISSRLAIRAVTNLCHLATTLGEEMKM